MATRARVPASIGAGTGTRRRGHRDRDPDLVRLYLNEIGSVPLLTAAEEVALAKRIEAGLYAAELLRAAATGERRIDTRRRELETVAHDGRRAKERMIRANLRLVVAVVTRHYRRGMPLLDAIQEGNLGLIRAVEKFDYTRGYKFSTYATWWIRQAMQRGCMDQARTIRLPIHLVEKLDKLRYLDRDLTARLGRAPTAAELAAEAGMTTHRVAHLLRAGRQVVSLETPVGDDENLRLGDVLEDVGAPSGQAAAEHQALTEDVRAAVAALPPRQAHVIAQRYGLHDGRPRTLDDIGGELRLSRERVRQIEHRALNRMREVERDRLLLHWAG